MQQGSVTALSQAAAQDKLLAQFLSLVAVDTQADGSSTEAPSSKGQLALGTQLMEQLKKQGYAPQRTQQGAVWVHLPATAGCENSPSLVLLAHLDTAPDASGANIRPALVTDFDGTAIGLDNGLEINTDICPTLPSHKGEDIVVTDGRTLLGADDKAGVAVLLQLLSQLAAQPDKAHGELYVVFSTDEELGRSFYSVPQECLQADYGVTVDGCEIGELDVGTFNAKGCTVRFTGRSIHTGTAYGRMVNAGKVAAKFIAALPESEAPETTQGLEGFYHVYEVSGEVGEATVKLIVRDFDAGKLEQRIEFLQQLCRRINKQYAALQPVTCRMEVIEQYRNMSEVLQQHPLIVQVCAQAYAKAGVAVQENFVRGGTDGSTLSFAGVPCPNIFTGGLNCHGPYECLPVQSLHKAYQVTEHIVELMAQEHKA